MSNKITGDNRSNGMSNQKETTSHKFLIRLGGA